jgi:hypothetical protein
MMAKSWLLASLVAASFVMSAEMFLVFQMCEDDRALTHPLKSAALDVDPSPRRTLKN